MPLLFPAWRGEGLNALEKRLFPRAMSQGAVPARPVGECREVFDFLNEVLICFEKCEENGRHCPEKKYP